MIILTDIPQWLQELPFGRDACLGEWTDAGRGELDPFTGELWRMLGTGDRLWRGRCATGDPDEFWEYLVIVDQAPRSQFDVLKELTAGHAKWPANVACVALTGQGFHGHRGRPWQTERGNLHLSAACRMEVDASACGLSLTALPAVGLMDVLTDCGGWTAAPGFPPTRPSRSIWGKPPPSRQCSSGSPAFSMAGVFQPRPISMGPYTWRIVFSARNRT